MPQTSLVSLRTRPGTVSDAEPAEMRLPHDVDGSLTPARIKTNCQSCKKRPSHDGGARFDGRESNGSLVVALRAAQFGIPRPTAVIPVVPICVRRLVVVRPSRQISEAFRCFALFCKLPYLRTCNLRACCRVHGSKDLAWLYLSTAMKP
jgi:hypothetical protein